MVDFKLANHKRLLKIKNKNLGGGGGGEHKGIK